MLFPTNMSNWIRIILSLFTVFIGGLVIWGSNRGLDLSDESFYLLGFKYAGDYSSDQVPSFFRVYDAVFGRFNLSFIGMRLLRLHLTLFASLVLATGMKRILGDRMRFQLFDLFLFAVLGSFLSYTWSPLALSYNSMSYTLIMLIAGLWLIQTTENSIKIKSFLFGIIGFFAVLLFYVKATNLLLFPVLIVFSLLEYWKSPKPRSSFLNLVFFSISASLGFLVGLALLMNDQGELIGTAYDHFQSMKLKSALDSTHTFGHLMEVYSDNMIFIWNIIKYYLIVGIIILLVLKIDKLKRKLSLILDDTERYIPLLITIIYVAIEFKSIWTIGSPYLIFTPYLLLMLLHLIYRKWSGSKSDLLLLLLFTLPIVGAFGSNNGLSAQVLFYGAFYFLFMFFVDTESPKPIRDATILLVSLMLSNQCYEGIVVKPYRQFNRISCTMQTDEENLGNLLINPELNTQIEPIRWVSDSPLQYVLTTNYEKGLIGLLNKKPFTLSWIKPYTFCEVTAESLTRLSETILIFPEDSQFQHEFAQCLSPYGIDFEQFYMKRQEFEYRLTPTKKTETMVVWIPTGFNN